MARLGNKQIKESQQLSLFTPGVGVGSELIH